MSMPNEISPPLDMKNWIYTEEGYFPKDKVIIVKGKNGLEVLALIRDAEVDPVKISFSCDGTFEIETDHLAYLMFDAQIVAQLADLCDEAKEIYEAIEEFMDENLDYEIPDEMIVKPVQSAGKDVRMEQINAILGMNPLEM